MTYIKNSKCDNAKIQNVRKLNNSKCDKTQKTKNVKKTQKLKMCQNSKLKML